MPTPQYIFICCVQNHSIIGANIWICFFVVVERQTDFHFFFFTFQIASSPNIHIMYALRTLATVAKPKYLKEAMEYATQVFLAAQKIYKQLKEKPYNTKAV